MKQWLIIKPVVWFGWLSSIAVAQQDISGAITGSVSFPHVGIICIGNLAVFITSVLRRRLHLEMGARDLLATIIPGPHKLEKIRATTSTGQLRGPVIGLTTATSYENASVIMLTNSAGINNFFIRQFMKYISNAHDMTSILLEIHEQHSCNCRVLPRVPDIAMQRCLQLPRTQCLLPSLKCLDRQSHGCRRDLLDAQEIRVGCLNVKFSSAVNDALDFEFTTPAQKEPICICIPVSDDKWTELLIRSLKYKDQEEKGAIVAVSDALQNYLDEKKEDRDELGAIVAVSDALQNYSDVKKEDRDELGAIVAVSYALQSYLDEKKEGRDELVTYSTISLIMIRSVEISINLLLTVLFKVDGFSSSLAARRAVRSYVVDSKGNGLPANVFLTSGLVVVKSDSVCQVLKLRGNCSGILLFIVGCVNVVCSIAWALVLIAKNGGAGKWYEVPSMPPSKPRVLAIKLAVGISIGMDFSEFSKIFMKCFGKYPHETWNDIWKEINDIKKCIVLVVIVLEIVFAVGSGILGLNKGIGRWVYGVLQVLVWVKWAIGSYLLGVYSPEYVPRRAERSDNIYGRVHLDYTTDEWVDKGSLVYSSSFFLNAVLAGVMGNWAGVCSN